MVGSGSQFNNNDDPEYFGYECLTVAQIKDLLSESIGQVCALIQVSMTTLLEPSLAHPT